MNLRYSKIALLALSACIVVSSCQKTDLQESATQPADEVAAKAAAGKKSDISFEISSRLQQYSVKVKFKNASLKRIDEINGYLQQKIAKAAKKNAVTPTECSPTPFDAQIDKYINEFGALEFDLYGTYAAINQLATLIDVSKQYFGPKGQYNGLLRKYRLKLESFWNMPNEVVIKGEHNATLNDRDRIAEVYVLFGGVDEETAYAIADEILFINEISTVFIETPLLSFDAFATTDDIIVLGDGIMQVLMETGLSSDVVLGGIVAHEWGHQVQFNKSIQWYYMPPYLWPATPEFTRLVELEADFFASYFMGSKKGGAYNWKKLSQFFNLFYNIGDCSFTSVNHHGTPLQRMTTARVAYIISETMKYLGVDLTADQIHTLFIVTNGYIVSESLNLQAALTALKEPELRAAFTRLLVHKMELKNIRDGKLSQSAIENLK